MALQTIIQAKANKKTTLETFAVKLVTKVIHAPSAEAIERYIAVAVKALGNQKINGYIIQRFIDRVTIYLHNHTSSDIQQETNSRLARERLQEFRQSLSVMANK